MRSSMRWYFCATPPERGAHNMAVDESLMQRAARTGDAVFRVYGWSAPTLSLGRNQRARGCYDLRAARDLGVEFIRRPTGGRALLHHHEVTYSVTMPGADARRAHSAYEFINDVLLAGLRRLGVKAARATQTAAIAPGLRPCFAAPSQHEIVLDGGGRKLVGSAQWQHGGALLQHGSILVRDDQPLIARLLLEETTAVRSSAATLAEALGWEPSVADLSPLFCEALAATANTRVVPLEIDEEVKAAASKLRVTYEDDAWTWRR